MNTVFELEAKADHRGRLYPFDIQESLEFIPKRLFFITDVPAGTVRGHHAHLKTIQALICISGVIDVHMCNGSEEHIHRLLPGYYIIENPMTWTSMYFVEGKSVLLVVSSEEHNDSDYIKNFEEYKAIMAANNEKMPQNNRNASIT